MVLTLGIGATTATYSVVDAVVVRGLPFDESNRLVGISRIDLERIRRVRGIRRRRRD